MKNTDTVTVEMTVEQLMEIAHIIGFTNKKLYNGEISDYAEFLNGLVQKHVFDAEDAEN